MSRAPQTALSRLLQDGVAAHRNGAYRRAERIYRDVLRQVPDHPDALHLLGLVAHQQGRHDEALPLVQRAVSLRPDQPAFHNSLGVVRLAQGDLDAATDSFTTAVALQPRYAEALNNLGNAHQQAGRLPAAIDAYDRALAARPTYAEAYGNRGRALHLAGDLDAAVQSLRHALALKPGYAKAERYLGDTLAERGQRDEADAAYGRALAASPGDAETLAARAALYERASRLDEAVSVATAALARDPGNARALLALVRAERRLGTVADALARLAAFRPRETETMETQALLRFEEGMLADRLGAFDRAYQAFAAANVALEQAHPPSAADRAFFPEMMERLAARFTPAWLATWSPAPPPDQPPPVFLIGFPRSGTTLMEQSLDAHPALAGLEEKDCLDQVRRAVAAMPEGYPGALASLSCEAITGLRDLYFREVARHVTLQPGQRLVDKMPLNTIDAGLIHRLFPGAPLLLALRHPCDVVLSNFMQAFKPNAAMLHFASLDGAARFYAQVMALWRQYAAVLPLNALAVRYEDLVADHPGMMARILDFLGLAWDAAMGDYRERARQRAIATPSYHQVVQPIYGGAVGRWRRYAEPLRSVLPLLAPSIAAFGYDEPEGMDSA
jgi:tetratricopeptide (TPR) repeat protein